MPLEIRKLGKSEIQLTSMGLGLWAVGGDMWGPADDDAALDAISAALEAGVRFFDTADRYGQGHSEELLGRAMRGRREQFVVATKIGWQGFDFERMVSAYDRPEKIVAGVEGSLRRLQTGYVDLIQCHVKFREPNMEVFLEGFRRLVEQGKARAYGVSTGDFEFLQAFNAAGGAASLQIDYSLLNRIPEAEIFPYCQENNLGVIARGTLAMGILTGKFTPDTQFTADDWRRRWQENPDERRTFLQDLEKVSRLQDLFPGRSPAELALRFAVSHPAVTTVIPGVKNRRQLAQNLEALQKGPLDPAELDLLNEITPPAGGRMIWPA